MDGMVKLSRSRVGQDQLARLQGMSDLPMIILSELLALHITEDTHAQDHRLAVKGVTARVCQSSIIPRGNRLAKTVINRFTGCQIQREQMSKQIMGDLPDEKLAGAAPFL